MYNISKSTTSVKGNELGIFEETPEYLDQKDLNDFFKNLAPEIPANTFPIVHEIDGANNLNKPKKAGTEALLDFEISYPIIYPRKYINGHKRAVATSPAGVQILACACELRVAGVEMSRTIADTFTSISRELSSIHDR